MNAFEIRCFCGAEIVPLVQAGGLVPSRTLGERPATFFICPACSHIATIPMPRGEAQQRLNDVLFNPSDVKSSSYDAASMRASYESKGRQHIIDRVVSLLVEHFGTAQGIRLHDFGAGPGDLVHQLRQVGVDADGSDPSADAIRVAHELGNRWMCATDELSEAPGQFQAMLLHHALEHIPEPIDALRRCRRMLKANGLIIIFVPNGMFFPARTIDFTAWKWGAVVGHLHLYSPKSLETALTIAGFGRARAFGSDVGLVAHQNKPAEAPVSEDTLQTLWLMRAAFPKRAEFTYRDVCQHLPFLAEQGVTIELIATAVAES
ncbi:MAG: class I SAM-dependent methyltransferase [Deltaproteobacteria bacterium]|nr:class I SAM-dependent methyltransferase [Deltaproteobacteria bacterium]